MTRQLNEVEHSTDKGMGMEENMKLMNRVKMNSSTGLNWLRMLVVGVMCLSGPTLVNAQAPEPAPAEEEEESLDIQTLFEKAGGLMEENRWEEALKPLGVILKEYGPSGYEDFGPTFGVMHYRYAFCLKNLKKFEEALENYNICYTKGANKPDTPEEKKNPVWELSLLEMAIIKQALGKYEEALADYENFARNPAPAGTYDDAAFRVQVATCYSKAGKADKAKQLLDQLFAGEGGLNPRPDALFRGFLALMESWTSPETGDEETEKLAHQFIDVNQDRMAISAYDMARFEFNNRLLVLARSASENKQQTLAVRLIGLMSSSSAIVEDLQARSVRYGAAVPELLRQELEKYGQLIVADDGLDWIARLTLSGAYERLGNYDAAYAIYTHGVNSTTKESPHRPVLLFGAMRTAVATGQPVTSVALGKQFRKEYPDHEYLKNVNTLLLENLFFAGKYDEALGMAQEVRNTIPEEDPDRDLTDFVVGASLFNLGDIEKAQLELESHAKRFKDSKYKEPVRYFEAAALQRMKQWEKGIEKYESFAEAYPDSDYINFALLDLATCYFQMGKYDKCLETVDRLQQKSPDFSELDRAIAMRGDSHLMLANNEAAEEAYLEAKAMAEAAGDGHEVIVGRVLVQLVRAAVALKAPERVIEYYDQYMAKYKGGFYDAEVVVSSLESLKEAGRGKDALDALQEVIIRLGSGEDGTGIEEAINSYTEHYVQIVGPTELLEKLTTFVPEGVEVNNTLRAWLSMARIDLLSNDQYKDQFPKKDAQMQVAFEELEQFNKDELATYILVQVGRNLAAKDTAEGDAAAVEWFKAALDRGTSDYYPLALMGQARVLAKTGGSTTFNEAINAYDQVIRELKDRPENVEEAMLNKGLLYFQKEMWDDAAQVFLNMTEEKGFTKTRAQVFYLLGRAYQEKGNVDKALESFTPFVGPPLENYVQYSAEARVRAAEIQMAKGNDEKAFLLVKDTVSRMYKLDKHPEAGPWVQKAKDHYKKLRDQLQKQPDPDEGVWGVR